MRFLYRGFSITKYSSVSASLKPRLYGEFSHLFLYDGTIRCDGSASHGRSDRNAVHWHELGQSSHPTSGISTSPHRDRAVFYALSGGKDREGIVIKIDRENLANHGVREYVVADTVTNPSIPADDEVILVGASGDPLPLAIVLAEERVYLGRDELRSRKPR